MKKIILSVLTLFSLTAFAQESRVINTSMKSDILGAEKTYTVYLPAGYDDSDTRYPVLFLLHGAWGTDLNWTEKGGAKQSADSLISAGLIAPLIIVMPDARGTGEDMGGPHMGYFNVPGWNYEQYFHEEFIPYIDSCYRTVPDKNNRAIAGLSMGGGGSVAYAQKHPEIYGSASSLSGVVGCVSQPWSRRNGEEFNKVLVENDPAVFVENATPEQLDALKTVRWYADCGDDDQLYEGNVAFYLAMKKNGIPIEYRMRDGAHSWTYWKTGLPAVLEFSSRGFTGKN